MLQRFSLQLEVDSGIAHKYSTGTYKVSQNLFPFVQVTVAASLCDSFWWQDLAKSLVHGLVLKAYAAACSVGMAMH